MALKCGAITTHQKPEPLGGLADPGISRVCTAGIGWNRLAIFRGPSQQHPHLTAVAHPLPPVQFICVICNSLRSLRYVRYIARTERVEVLRKSTFGSALQPPAPCRSLFGYWLVSKNTEHFEHHCNRLPILLQTTRPGTAS